MKFLFVELGKTIGEADLGREVEAGIAMVTRHKHTRFWISMESFHPEIQFWQSSVQKEAGKGGQRGRKGTKRVSGKGKVAPKGGWSPL